MSTSNLPDSPDNQPDTALSEENETAEEAEEGGGFGYGVLRMLVAAPGLIVARFTYDLIPFLPQWGEYILLTVASFALGNILISGLVAIGKRADRLSAQAKTATEVKEGDSS